MAIAIFQLVFLFQNTQSSLGPSNDFLTDFLVAIDGNTEFLPSAEYLGVLTELYEDIEKESKILSEKILSTDNKHQDLTNSDFGVSSDLCNPVMPVQMAKSHGNRSVMTNDSR